MMLSWPRRPTGTLSTVSGWQVENESSRERRREKRNFAQQRRLFFFFSKKKTKKHPLALGLRRDNFADTHALLCLHVWLLLVRLRSEGANGAQAAQLLYDFFSDDAESRVRAAGVRVRVSKWLAELEKMFYGAATAYDKALGSPGSSKNDDGAFSFTPPADARRALSKALLRNVFGVAEGGDEEKRRLREKSAGLLSDYIIREIACLSQTGSDAVLDGRLRFTAVKKKEKRGAASPSPSSSSLESSKDSDDEKAA